MGAADSMGNTAQETEATVVSFPDGHAEFVVDAGTRSQYEVLLDVPAVKPFVLTDDREDAFALVRQRASGDFMAWEGDGELLEVVGVEHGVTLTRFDGNTIQWHLPVGPYAVRVWRGSDGEVCRIEFRLDA